MIRKILINTSQRLVELGASGFSQKELLSSSLIVSPHYDDETLGCGGMIHLKRQAGADVHVVFMTDGTTSHAHLMKPQELGRLRKAEGIDACARLGVPSKSITHLGIPERQVGQRFSDAVDLLGKVLESLRPAQVFCPYRADVNPDHEATYRATIAAMRAKQYEATLFEFPIWAWYEWPWCRIPLKGRRYIPYQAALAFYKNLFFIKRFNRVLRLGTSVTIKRRALECHRSQMVRLVDDRSWRILADVAQGDFLQRLLSNEEWFIRSQGSRVF